MHRIGGAAIMVLLTFAGFAQESVKENDSGAALISQQDQTTTCDTVIDKAGNRIPAIVTRILPDTVEYKKASNPDGPTYVVGKQSVAMVVYANGERDSFTTDAPVVKNVTPATYNRFSASLEMKFGAFGLFNVDNVFTKARYSFGGTPSFMVRLHRHFAAGAECMLLWGQADTSDPLRFIINPNLRAEVLFPLRPKLTLTLVVAGGMSIWPVHDTLGVLDSTFFNQRGGWNARAAFGGEWKFTPLVSLLCTVGYSASSSESADVWITHDMMMVSAGVRMSLGEFTK